MLSGIGWCPISPRAPSSFRFQFMSNEREFPSALPELKKTAKPDGIYLGVGPEQNFTYIATTTPKLAFIFDIRRENMLEHLIYKALFELSSSRSDFISRLFSRRAPVGLNDKSTVGALFQAYGAIAPDSQLLRQNLQAIKDRLLKDHHLPLTAEDQASIDNIYRTICEAGPGPAPSSGNQFGAFFGGGRGGANYAELMMATDEKGVAHSYLAVEESFRFVQDMEKRNRIVPLVGDFAGTKAIRAVAKYPQAITGATVATFLVLQTWSNTCFSRGMTGVVTIRTSRRFPWMHPAHFFAVPTLPTLRTRSRGQDNSPVPTM